MPAPRVLKLEEWPPNYVSVAKWRQQQLIRMREKPGFVLGAFEYYRHHWPQFIVDWVDTFDPRGTDSGLPMWKPFVLFERQGDLVEFIYLCMQGQTNGLIEKARDMGATWICVAISVCLWLFTPGAAIEWGSQKSESVDRIGDMSSIFEKIRQTIRRIPRDFLPLGFSGKEHLLFMRVINPQTGAVIAGSVGDNIGRGGRSTIAFKDEAAHYEHPELIEASLGDNTRVQIDVSSVNGLGNVFHRKRENGIDWQPGKPVVKNRVNVFVLDWRDHPEKTQAWYDGRRVEWENNGMQHLFAQEVDRDYSAAVEGIIIPALWVKSAVDAHVALKFDDEGGYTGGLDVADGGGDLNAFCLRKGVILKDLDIWGARDPGITTRHALDIVTKVDGFVDLQYDSIGVGSGVKTESNRLSDENLLPQNVRFVSWEAGASPLNPEGYVITDGRGNYDRNSPKNKDFYTNLKAQAWWELRLRFERTHRARTDPSFSWKPDQLISIPRGLPHRLRLEKELSQPTASQGARMKLLVDKRPEGVASPNAADAVVMAYWPARGSGPIRVTQALLTKIAQAGARQAAKSGGRSHARRRGHLM